jgi:hypothetical protein
MRILTDCSFLSEKQIEKIAEKYNAKYVFESQLKLRGGNWSDFSAAVFYTEIPHPEGSNWFGIWRNGEKYMISNAISAVEEPFFGVLADNGDVIYSRHRHDDHASDDGELFIGGGRSHTSHDLTHLVVKLIVSKDKVVIVPKENKKTWCEVPYTEELDWDMAET